MRFPIATKESPRQHRLVVGVLVGCCATLFLLGLESWFRPLAIKGMYFQAWSSERMMQTVSIEDLRDEPLRSLWNLHIDPPVFDAIRAGLVGIWNTNDSGDLVRNVDFTLYILWALVYGIAGFVMFIWLSEISTTWFAAAATCLFLVHPACILYATYLETTFLTATLILCFYYFLWRAKEGTIHSAGPLVLCFLLLFLTRSLFQAPWLILFTLSLLLVKLPLRSLAIFFIVSGVVISLYTAKQTHQFGLASTSSFTGLSLLKSIGYNVSYRGYAQQFPTEEPVLDKPRVLTRIKKIEGSVNYNNENYLSINNELTREYFERVASSSPGELAGNYIQNLRIYFRPSSTCESNVIVERLPWRRAYDLVFSAPVLPVALAIAVGIWMLGAKRSDYRGGVGLFLPAFVIALLSVLCDRWENMRFKFFIEPVLFVFLASQCYEGSRRLSRYLRSFGAQ
ncbi:MAG: hypothetical protein HY913_03065 [Desulfomonile tiedjei]|nr:hypothetical protein [Desulfomonile tiedjei]